MKTLVARQPNQIQIWAGIFVISLLIALSSSCKQRAVISMDGKTPPTFNLDHVGKISSFTVYEIVPTDPTSYKSGRLTFPLVADRVALWTLEPDPSGEAPNSLRVSYGQPPPRFIQTYPKEGPPSVLIEERFYGATATTDEPNELSIAFAVHDGKIIIQ
jgi:hypothetical protein